MKGTLMSYPLEAPVGSNASSTYTNISNDSSTGVGQLSYQSKNKEDAEQLAKVIYNIFKDSLSNDKMDKKGEKHVQ